VYILHIVYDKFKNGNPSIRSFSYKVYLRPIKILILNVEMFNETHCISYIDN